MSETPRDPLRVDLDPHRRIVEAVVDQGQPGLVLADGRIALALEAGVDQGELPGRRGLLGQYAIAAADEAQIREAARRA